MSRLFLFATVVLLMFRPSSIHAQGDLSTLVKYSKKHGAKIYDVSEPALGKTSLENPDLPRDRILVDLFDCQRLRWNLEQLVSARSEITIVLGNAMANLELRSYMDALEQIECLEVLILDSVDYSEAQIDRLKKRNSKLQVIFSERAAIRCIRQSYRVEQTNDVGSLFTREQAIPKNLWFVDSKHFEVAERFIGIRWHPCFIEPIPRDALRFFRHLSHLEHIDLGRTDLTDNDLRYFGKNKKLTFLGLEETKITGKGLNRISGNNLNKLILYRTRNLKMVPFHRFQNLEYLTIAESSLPVSEFPNLVACKRLSTLRASETLLSFEEITLLLQKLPDLEFLEISNSNIRKDDPRLKQLRNTFPSTTITDSSPK